MSDADYAPGRTRYENTGQLQLLRKSYQYGTPTNSPTLGNSRSNQTSTQEVDVHELTQQLKIPLYKQLIGNTAMVDLSSLSANPQVCSCAKSGAMHLLCQVGPHRMYLLDIANAVTATSIYCC